MTHLGITPDASPPVGSANVLIVDDESMTRSLVSKKVALLKANAIEAEDGVEAWELLQKNSVRLAIVDLEMPNMDGFELLQRMRSNPRTQQIPAIVLTSHEDTASIEEALAAGATSYLQKPLNWGLFGDHIALILRLSQGTNSSPGMA